MSATESSGIKAWTFPQLEIELVWDADAEFFVQVPLE